MNKITVARPIISRDGPTSRIVSYFVNAYSRNSISYSHNRAIRSKPRYNAASKVLPFPRKQIFRQPCVVAIVFPRRAFILSRGQAAAIR